HNVVAALACGEVVEILSHHLPRRPPDFETVNLLAGPHFPQPDRGKDELTGRRNLLFRVRVRDEPFFVAAQGQPAVPPRPARGDALQLLARGDCQDAGLGGGGREQPLPVAAETSRHHLRIVATQGTHFLSGSRVPQAYGGTGGTGGGQTFAVRA